ncbi:MAG: hypothetical protein KKE30_12305 [Gammaproteobacteria bacterium]|nr:hypothetical protein [Gammaproteobacteria bacterium]MBU1554815.1 hypothetical protein [Gammaproteobacteria bacterium]MBU2070265.1 hypothetical protein [Gammaproteobacteria bacterium]MBU2183968.1 hypothetical protein [Gammaproteobacteria bacterium]MBU2206772.1 hypothetical protein [Gammaproteobacteria bacterium]
MKKTIALTHPKLVPARLVDSIKYDIKKYLNRERRKTLPQDTDYWTFDCRFGATEEVAATIFTSEINKHIDAAVAQELPSFYIEILARACKHKPRPTVAEADAADDDGE